MRKVENRTEFNYLFIVHVQQSRNAVGALTAVRSVPPPTPIPLSPHRNCPAGAGQCPRRKLFIFLSAYLACKTGLAAAAIKIAKKSVEVRISQTWQKHTFLYKYVFLEITPRASMRCVAMN